MFNFLKSILFAAASAMGPQCRGIRVVVNGDELEMLAPLDPLPETGDVIEVSDGRKLEVLSGRIAEDFYDFIYEVTASPAGA
jgi:hypothetical protein